MQCFLYHIHQPGDQLHDSVRQFCPGQWKFTALVNKWLALNQSQIIVMTIVMKPNNNTNNSANVSSLREPQSSSLKNYGSAWNPVFFQDVGRYITLQIQDKHHDKSSLLCIMTTKFYFKGITTALTTQQFIIPHSKQCNKLHCSAVDTAEKR